MKNTEILKTFFYQFLCEMGQVPDSLSGSVHTQGGAGCDYLLPELHRCRGRVRSSRCSHLLKQTAEQPGHGGVMQQQSGLAGPQQGLHEPKGTGVKGRKGSKQHQIGRC